MDIKVLEYIVEIAEQKSVSRAAEKFYLSQPALSRCLAKVEESVGAPLFYRNHNELALTEAGTVYLNCARAVLHTYRSMLAELAALPPDAESAAENAVESTVPPGPAAETDVPPGR